MGLTLAICFSFCATKVCAQSVTKQGTMFVQQSKKCKSATKTKYTYKAADGKVYPIYLSPNGKAFIIRVSKKTNKEYRDYLPEVTKQLQSGSN